MHFDTQAAAITFTKCIVFNVGDQYAETFLHCTIFTTIWWGISMFAWRFASLSVLHLQRCSHVDLTPLKMDVTISTINFNYKIGPQNTPKLIILYKLKANNSAVF